MLWADGFIYHIHVYELYFFTLTLGLETLQSWNVQRYRWYSLFYSRKCVTISCSIHVDKLIMFKRCWGWKIKGWSGTKHRVEWPDKKNEGVIALSNYFPNLYKRFIKTSGGTILTPTRSPGLPCRYLSDCVPKQRWYIVVLTVQ